MDIEKISRRINVDKVLIGLDIIPSDEQEALLKALNSLDNFSPDQPLDSKMKKGVLLGRTFYLFDVTPNYQLIFEINDRNEIQVVDLFVKGRLEAFAKLAKH